MFRGESDEGRSNEKTRVAKRRRRGQGGSGSDARSAAGGAEDLRDDGRQSGADRGEAGEDDHGMRDEQRNRQAAGRDGTAGAHHVTGPKRAESESPENRAAAMARANAA